MTLMFHQLCLLMSLVSVWEKTLVTFMDLMASLSTIMVISDWTPYGLETSSTLLQTQTTDILTSTICSYWAQLAQIVPNTPSYTKMTVFHIAHKTPISMERPVLNVQWTRDGTVQIVLIDVQMAEYGIQLLRLVNVLLANPGTDSFVLLVQMEEPGTWTLKVVNAQSHPPGMESPVLFVLEEESTTHQALSANAQSIKPGTDSYVTSTVLKANSTMTH